MSDGGAERVGLKVAAWALAAAFALWAALAALGIGGQRRFMLHEWHERFLDFYMPRIAAETADCYEGVDADGLARMREDWRRRGRPATFGLRERLDRRDACYPALCYVMLRPLPPTDLSGFAVGAVGVMLLVGAAWALLRAWRLPGLAAAAVAVFPPVLSALERGQTVTFAAAGAVLFVAWHDSPSRARRAAAALALAFAAALKVTPALFAVFYLPELRRRVPELTLMAAAGALMLFVPFIWWGGADGFRLWLANAAANAADLVTFSAWSPVQFDRSLLLLTGRTIDEVRALGCVWSRRAAVLLGAAAVFGAMWRVFRVERSSRDYPTVMLLLAALVWLPGNMLCYTGAYFVPAAALWWRDASEGRRGLRFWAELAAWCAIWCMLQVPLGTGTANRTVACLAWHALVLMAAVPVRSAGPVPSAV